VTQPLLHIILTRLLPFPHSLEWEENNAAKVALLAVSSLSGNISIHSVMTERLTCTTELHRLTLKSLIADSVAGNHFSIVHHIAVVF